MSDGVRTAEHFEGETSPLFSQSQAKLARQFHQKIA
ncbi:hypothetical protein ACUODJ_57340, partial [Escherichia sp. HC-CC]